MALNILVVDDSATVRSIMAKTFKIAGLNVGELHEAENGKEALDILADHWIDIVFADINMPVMGGVEMVEKMSADGLLNTIPVVIVSTEGSTTRMEQLRAKGISGYIRKPFTPEILCNVVNDVVGGLT
ncbi:MAG: response regulator [Candidatus Hydrogenedentes bacterium]|nr:response regulator [Candidatus Hydrogenedentota bacterium]